MEITNSVPITSSGTENGPSKVDIFTGKHTTGIIVAILFVLVLISFILIYCIKDTVSENVITGHFSLLSLLAGFYAGSSSSKNN